MQEQISMGTFDSPSWELIRVSKLATRMYAPLGTYMALGDYVRISKGFIEVFKWALFDAPGRTMLLRGSEEEDEELSRKRSVWINQLRYDLKVIYGLILSRNNHDSRSVRTIRIS